MPASPPNSRTNLDKAIQRLAGSPARFVDIRSLLAAAIVGQFMPEGVAKGGGALQLRFGSAGTRATHDFDAARRGRLDAFLEALGGGLRAGWNGFTGVVVPGRPARPRGVPGEYVMRPFSVKLSYLGHAWCTVALEVGHNEIGDADEPDFALAPEVAGWFAALGLPTPEPVPLMPLEFQVAQKLHAATAPGSQRAHDLIDLQLIATAPISTWRAFTPFAAACSPIGKCKRGLPASKRFPAGRNCTPPAPRGWKSAKISAMPWPGQTT